MDILAVLVTQDQQAPDLPDQLRLQLALPDHLVIRVALVTSEARGLLVLPQQ